MTRQLFIYYRIPKADIALGLTCAENLMHQIKALGLGSGELFQREEADKPYFTLMEVITPTATQAEPIETFAGKIEQLAANCFSSVPSQPSRHVEIFTSLTPKG
jgi:hypothetical protein